MKKFTLEGRITILKSLAVSEVVRLLSVTKILNYTMIFCRNYIKTLLGKGKNIKFSIVLFAILMKRKTEKMLI